MNIPQPTVKWDELQRRKLQVMAETVEHYKEVSGMKILIKPNVYPPGTDTYLLANTVQIHQGDEVLDLCTGTGAIACKLALLGAKSVLSVDLNARAVDNAKANAEHLRLDNVQVRQGNMFAGIDKKFDIITINPPYTDKKASDDIDICFYDEGHKFVKSFFQGVRGHLKPGGTAFIAWSNISSMELLPKLATEYGYDLSLVSQDVGGRGYTFYVYTLKDIHYEQNKNL